MRTAKSKATNPKAASPIDVHVGARVRQARLLAGISQEKLGAGLGLTFQQVQKYEKGANRIVASRLEQIARLLGKPVAWFFGGLAVEAGALKLTGDDPLADLGATREGVALARAFNAIADRAARDAVLATAQAFASLAARDQGRKSAA